MSAADSLSFRKHPAWYLYLLRIPNLGGKFAPLWSCGCDGSGLGAHVVDWCRKVAVPVPDHYTWDEFLNQVMPSSFFFYQRSLHMKHCTPAGEGQVEATSDRGHISRFGTLHHWTSSRPPVPVFAGDV
jgi:hypothetical protein